MAHWTGFLWPEEIEEINSKRETIARTSQDDEEEGEGKGNILRAGRFSVPIFTANGIRGMLRRKAGDLILRAAGKTREDAAKKTIKDMDIVNMIRVGGGRNFSDQSEALPTEVEEYVLTKNIHLGLFGGGLNIDGRLSNTDLVPVCLEVAPKLERLGLEMEDYNNIPFSWEIKDFRSWVRKNDWGKDPTEKILFDEETINTFFVFMDEQRDNNKKKKELQKQGKDIDDELKKSPPNIGQLGKYELICPGTRMFCRFDMTNI